MESRLAINEKKKGKKRGPYKPRARLSDERELLSGQESIREVRGERYMVLNSGNLLIEEWKDIYEWYAWGGAPDDWISRLRRTEPNSFRDVDRAMEMNSNLV